MNAWWISWYSNTPASEFELHSPWWVSGYDAGDRTIYVAAVRADSEPDAWRTIVAAYDHEPDLIERFCDEMTDPAWSPFADRWPQAKWMAWDDDRTCACPTHPAAASGGDGEGTGNDG